MTKIARPELAPLPADHDLTHLTAALKHLPAHRSRVAVDGGAHRGIWTHQLAGAFDTVIAFEPVSGLAAQIPDEAGVHVIRAALAAQWGEAGFGEGPENTGQGHVLPGDAADVTLVPLDALGLEALDLLKLDVEGYELFALQGAAETVERCRPWIMVERNRLSRRYGIDGRAVHRWLVHRGYRAVMRANKDYLYRP